MKALSLLLLLTAFLLTSCNTLSNRRDLYSYKREPGPYTKRLDEAQHFHAMERLEVKQRTTREYAR